MKIKGSQTKKVARGVAIRLISNAGGLIGLACREENRQNKRTELMFRPIMVTWGE